MHVCDCMCVCACVCASPLCGRASMGPSDGSRGGSCHGNRGCRLAPRDLSCPRILRTSLFCLSPSYSSLVYFCSLCILFYLYQITCSLLPLPPLPPHPSLLYLSSPPSFFTSLSISSSFPISLHSPIPRLPPLTPFTPPLLCYSCNRYK